MNLRWLSLTKRLACRECESNLRVATPRLFFELRTEDIRTAVQDYNIKSAGDLAMLLFMTDFFTKPINCLFEFDPVAGISVVFFYVLSKWFTPYYDYLKNKNDNKTKLEIEKLKIQKEEPKTKKSKK